MKIEKIDIIVEIPLDLSQDQKLRRSAYVVAEILKHRDWNQEIEKKITIRNKKATGSPIIELHTVLTPSMTGDDLAALAAKFIDLIK
ncbi:MAG: hypothetical protein LBK26_02340 [Rickettsiales bacterium]|jgi:hypothetical protein|nr:hypothetical protein [Rickettsiales bacterium]